MRAARDLWDRPSVIVCRERLAASYYRAATEEEFTNSALAILKKRHMEGHWYLPPDKVFDREPQIDMNEEGLRYVKAGSLAHKHHLSQVLALKNYRETRAEYEAWLVKKNAAIDANNGLLAWECLCDRSDLEYEAVVLEPLS